MYVIGNKLGSVVSSVYQAYLNSDDQDIEPIYSIKLFYSKTDYQNELNRGLPITNNFNLSKVIIPVLDYGQLNNNYFILYPYYKYNLEQIIKNNIIFDNGINFICNLVNLVYQLHQAGLAHNDIQPVNILYNNEYILADLGTVSTGNEPMYNTSNFAAPEIINNWGKIGTLQDMQLADIWSLGAIFYYVYTNKYPSYQQNNIIHTPDSNINSIVNSMLQINPQDRINLEQIWRVCNS